MTRGEASPAVVLATRPLGDADLLVVLLTPGHGKIRAAARNARKSKRRFAGGLAGGARGEAMLVPRPGSLWRLETFTPVMAHGKVGRDLTRFAYVAYLCELADALVVEPEPDPRVFSALVTALGATVEQEPDAAVLRWFELTLLGLLGHLPALADCAVCGSPVSLTGREVAYDLQRGGVLCPAHAGGAGRVPTAVVATALALHDAAEPPRWQDPAGASEASSPPAASPPPASVRRGLRDLLVAAQRRHLTRPLRALEFFAQLPTRG